MTTYPAIGDPFVFALKPEPSIRQGEMPNISSLRNSYGWSAFAPISMSSVVAEITAPIETLRGAWLMSTVQALVGLLALPDGWDSYGAKHVEPKAVQTILEFLLAVLEPDSPKPSIVATPSGGTQAEWHRNNIDLEIEANRDGKLEYYYKGAKLEQEGPILNPGIVRTYVKQLARA